MITRFEYAILKAFKESKNGLTEEEYEELDLVKNDNHRLPFHHLLRSNYVKGDYSSVDMNIEGWLRRLKHILTEKGNEAIDFYEKWIMYPHTCDQNKEHTGIKYVIVEHRSGCFCTKVYHYAYTSNIGFTNHLEDATLYCTHEDAEKALAEAIKDSPTKYQNPGDYEFSIEEVKLTANIELPKTYMCKDCGRVLPIKDYYISTCCPDSWNTGVCEHCRYERRRKEREAMYGRNSRGVYDYDSLDI